MGAPIRSFLRLPLAPESTQTIRIRRSGRGGERRNGAPGSNRRGEKKPLRKRRKTRKNAPENVPLPRLEVLLLPLFRRAAGGASARPARAQSCIARRIYSLRTSTCGFVMVFQGRFWEVRNWVLARALLVCRPFFPSSCSTSAFRKLVRTRFRVGQAPPYLKQMRVFALSALPRKGEGGGFPLLRVPSPLPLAPPRSRTSPDASSSCCRCVAPAAANASCARKGSILFSLPPPAPTG